MSKFTFICEEEPCPFGDSIISKRTVEFNAVHLDGIIGEFETFLRGCGFNLKGNLEIVEAYAKETFPLNHKDEEYDLDDLDSIFNGKSLIRSDEC